MRITGIFERGKVVAAQWKHALTDKEQESEKGRSNLLLQILIALSLITAGILLGYFFPVR
jgi:hypothetical protein